MSGHRVAGGISIDRDRPVRFRWAGKDYSGFGSVIA